MTDIDALRARLLIARVPGDAVRTSANITSIVNDLSREDMDVLAAILHDDADTRHAGSDVSAQWFATQQQHTEAGTAWPSYLSEWLTSIRSPDDHDEAFELASSAITWQLRIAHTALLNALTLGQVITEMESSDPHFQTHLAILLQTARYDFNFIRIEQILNAVGESVTNSSLYYRAMLQYSRMGRAKQVTADEIETIAGAARDSEKILSLLLHGLWFTSGRAYAEQMLALGSRLLELNPDNAVTHMRMASAYRRLGRFDDAIRAINDAIKLHPPADREAHNDFKLERVTIAIQQDAKLRLDAEIARQLEIEGGRQRRKLNSLIERTNDQLSDSLFKVVEILGVFTAIIGAIATVVASNAAGDGIEWWGRVLIVLAGGLIILGFFALLRWIVRPPRPTAVDDASEDEITALREESHA
ncbi:tetratricopeptide repeat protein [Gordonia sp. PP30]|uniref:tetratricopeptide repeat protein n=1 Tax=Gordonia sp. PP30 TaxID=2935861 RepID=UPI001FFFB3F5|nr:tetratricopeptide repeat protein [Gordonia sp. PP30]UQE73266.1 tetratricopeptide repeat protein [Gordonia sp. PP30]